MISLPECRVDGNVFGILDFGHWDLFGICILLFGIFMIIFNQIIITKPQNYSLIDGGHSLGRNKKHIGSGDGKNQKSDFERRGKAGPKA
jgi:hypothetical protein